ncbi:MAG: hypothetical protein IT553_03965 [Sphingomonadaceae bacterium]|nr:hypothetical protein [Sphingomonadaceae bacterium]
MISDQEKAGCFIHDFVFEYLILMRDTFKDRDCDDFSNGFVWGLYEGYAVLYEQLALFELTDNNIFSKLPEPDEWLRVGPASIEPIVGKRPKQSK